MLEIERPIFGYEPNHPDVTDRTNLFFSKTGRLINPFSDDGETVDLYRVEAVLNLEKSFWFVKTPDGLWAKSLTSRPKFKARKREIRGLEYSDFVNRLTKDKETWHKEVLNLLDSNKKPFKVTLSLKKYLSKKGPKKAVTGSEDMSVYVDFGKGLVYVRGDSAYDGEPETFIALISNGRFVRGTIEENVDKF